MAITRLGGANAISGTIPQGNIANASLGAVTALPFSTGVVLQIVQTVKTDSSSSSGYTYGDLGLSASITPASTSNKILVVANLNTATTGNLRCGIKLLRGSTSILLGDTASDRTRASVAIGGTSNIESYGSDITFLDTPSTTSSTTYKIQGSGEEAGASVYLNRNHNDTNSGTYYRGTSTLTLMEIAG